MSAPYSCIRDLLFELNADAGDANAPDVFNGVRYLKTATERIQRKLIIRFQPFLERKSYDPSRWSIDPQTGVLSLPETMFSISSALNGSGDSLDPSNYTAYPALTVPFSGVQMSALATQQGLSWFNTFCGNGSNASSLASLLGLWGWHGDYLNAWTDTLDVIQNNPLTSNSRTILVSSISESDILGRFPRFSPGQLLKFGDEYAELTSIDQVNETLTVLRGQNGTVAVEHAQNTPIYVWDPPWDVQQATSRYAAYPYKRRGDYSKGAFDSNSGIATSLPPDMPGDVREILQSYANGVPEW